MEFDVKDLTKEMLLDKNFANSIFENYKNKKERDNILKEVYEVARKYSVLPKVKKQVTQCESEYKLNKMGNIINILAIGMDGKPEPTIDNYYSVMTNDPKITEHIKFNLLTNKFEYWEGKNVREWRDKDDAKLLSYIESEYNFYNIQKYELAKNKTEDYFSYHPIKDIIEADVWDGKPRIDKFLSHIMRCEDDDYSRELSRMIFYGGINRLYNPGCKFDYMPIFMGSQGCGKSTIVEWLNLKNDYYREVLSIDGGKGIESISGGWICEFAELLAMIRAKEVESLKGYITRINDVYRPAYGHNVISLPRQCIFIGTTNTFEFLVDKTGNRRYLPIEIHLRKGELYKHEKYVKNYILQCWREAKDLYDDNKTYLVIPHKYNPLLEMHQDMATDDDPKIGVIIDYLDSKEVGYKLCGQEIFVNCCNGLKKNYSSKDGREISIILRRFPEWQRVGNPIDFPGYGRQKYWEKVGEPDELDEEIDTIRDERELVEDDLD